DGARGRLPGARRFWAGSRVLGHARRVTISRDDEAVGAGAGGAKHSCLPFVALTRYQFRMPTREDQEAAAVLDAHVQETLWTVERATAPIYREELGRPVPNGSAVLLRVGDRPFALTAAHVTDNSALFPLYIGSSSQ